MKKIAITGSNGVIGSILMKNLKSKYTLTGLDHSHCDVSKFPELLKRTKDCDAIIHLAWDTKRENCNNKKYLRKNTKMYENVYDVALKNKIKRVIMASSVHTDNYIDWKNRNLISVKRKSTPTSPYGQHKINMENMGRIYSKRGIEVICIRFDGIAPRGHCWNDVSITGLAHPDLVSLIKKCIESKKVPNNFIVLYAVSKNKKRIHDISNPFNWKPKLDAEKFYKNIKRIS